MTIALATLPRSQKEIGEGSCQFTWSGGGTWTLTSDDCTVGTATEPDFPGTTVGQVEYGTCSMKVDDNQFIHTLMQDPEGRIDDIVEQYHSQALSRLLCSNPAVVINRGNGCIIHNYEQTPTPKINQLVIPTGATRWAYCLLLADDDIKDQIYETCRNGSTSMNLVYGTPITGREEKEHSIVLTVKVLPPRRLSPYSDDETLNSLWIIPVVDDRYTWQFAHTGDLSAAVADSEITLPDDAATFLLDQLGVDYINVGVNTAHTLVPACLTKNDYENLPIVLDSIAAHYGQRLVPDIGCYDTTSGKYNDIIFTSSPGGRTRWALIDGVNSTAVFDNNLLGKLGLRTCTWVSAITANPSASSASYNVGKPFVVAGGISSTFDNTSTQRQSPFAAAPASVDIQTTAGSYVNRTAGLAYKTFPVAAIWRTEYNKTPSSGVMDQVGRDYFYQYFRLYDYTFAGVQPWQQGYFDDYMVLRQTWNPKTCSYDAYTRVCSRQPNLNGEWAGKPTERMEAVLKEDLESPTSSTATPTTADVYYLTTNADGTMTVIAGTHSVTNNDPDLAANRGTYCRIEQIGGRWKFYYVGCGPQQDLIDAMDILEA